MEQALAAGNEEVAKVRFPGICTSTVARGTACKPDPLIKVGTVPLNLALPLYPHTAQGAVRWYAARDGGSAPQPRALGRRAGER